MGPETQKRNTVQEPDPVIQRKNILLSSDFIETQMRAREAVMVANTAPATGKPRQTPEQHEIIREMQIGALSLASDVNAIIIN